MNQIRHRRNQFRQAKMIAYERSDIRSYDKFLDKEMRMSKVSEAWGVPNDRLDYYGQDGDHVRISKFYKI
jgi:hypothetical protein